MWRAIALLFLSIALTGCRGLHFGVPSGATRDERNAAWDEEARRQSSLRESMESPPETWWEWILSCIEFD